MSVRLQGAAQVSPSVVAEGFARYMQIPSSTLLVVSQEGSPGGEDSLGLTPYFFFLALPDGQPPRVTTISIFWAILARRFPFLAFVQIGQRDSQTSGSFKFKIAIFYPHRTCCFCFHPHSTQSIQQEATNGMPISGRPKGGRQVEANVRRPSATTVALGKAFVVSARAAAIRFGFWRHPPCSGKEQRLTIDPSFLL